jgi:small ligand-binding sensory domain FIST
MQTPLFGGAAVGPWLGMYGFGEFARLGGRNQFHNYTTALYVITRA